jgi:glutamate/aspartate transport system substrate-binding protein
MRTFCSTPTLRAAAALALMCTIGLSAQAAELTGVLKKIKDNGEIVVGHRDSSIPFSYLDDKAQPVGYSMDLCARVVDAVKAQIGAPSLRVKYQTVTSQNRIPLVANGTVDIECGSTVNNAERQAQVSFSVTTFVVATRFIAFKSANLKTLEDLRGKTVVCTTGTNTVKRVRDLDATHKLNLNFVFGKDHADSMLLVASSRAAAFFEDDILLTGLASASANPADYALSTEGYSADPYALMIPKGDAAFKKVVDDTLTGLFKSGEINKIYAKWYMSPIPPRGVSLNFPMGPALKKVIANPTDAPDPARYQ